MLASPFYGEIPDDLGYEAAWLGRELMLSLMSLPRHQPADPGASDGHPTAVGFACEWHDDAGNGSCSCGNETREFDDHPGLSELGLCTFRR